MSNKRIIGAFVVFFALGVSAEEVLETTTHSTHSLAIPKEKAVENGHRHKPLSVDLWRDEVLIPWMAKQFFWPWRQLSQAVAAFDEEEEIERTSIRSENNTFQITMSVKRFKPEEIKVSVKNRYILVTGKHIEKDDDDKKMVANQFEQRFALPPGAKPDEVTSKLENGILNISVAIHPLPPPEPEREVPITIVQRKEDNVEATSSSAANESTTETTSVSSDDNTTMSVAPLEVSSPSTTTNKIETSSYHGKIRKKDLKQPIKKVPKKTESTKNDENNNLDEVLTETE